MEEIKQLSDDVHERIEYFDHRYLTHATLLGTRRPAHYRVLVDDNKFKADEIQSLTNKLCYLNARLVIHDLVSASCVFLIIIL